MAHLPNQDVGTNEVLSMEEINTRFNGEWVLLEDPEVGVGLKVLGGKVLGHSKDRKEVYRIGMQLNPTHSAYLYMGEPDKDMAYLL